MNTFDLVLIVSIFLLAVGLAAIVWVERIYKYNWLRYFYILPAILVWAMIDIPGFERDMLPAYVGGFLLVTGLFVSKERVRILASVAAFFLALSSLLFSKVDAAYRCPDFIADFEEGFAFLEERYCLTEHKEIDFDALYAKYYPRIQEAQAEHSKVLNAIAWHEMLLEFHDGHTYYATEEDVMEEMDRVLYGSDFGFSMVTLADGRNVAVNVEPGSKAEEAGIRLGTEIVSLGGKSVEDCKAEVVDFKRVIPEAETEKFYLAMYAAGQKADSLEVSFVDAQGACKNVTLDKIGDYTDRLNDTLETVNGGRNIGTLTFEEIDETSVLYRIKAMSFDTESYSSGDFSQLEEQFRNGLNRYKEAGFDKLIIDLRSNMGGSPQMIMTLAKLLSGEGEHSYIDYPVVDELTGHYLKDEATGKYQIGGQLTYTGENLWGHGEIILLVNAECISAGDHFTHMMYGEDNVTVMGFTKSNSSGQAITVHQMKTGMFSLSMLPIMNENGDIFLDPGADRVGDAPIDEIVPLDEAALQALFVDGEDYLLQQALAR